MAETQYQYASIVEADAYLTETRRDTAWLLLTDDEKIAALVEGARYLDAKYGRRWCGVRCDDCQVMDWPRVGQATSGCEFTCAETPVAVVNASTEAALLASTGTSLFPSAADSASGSVRLLRQKLGDLEEETEYATPKTISVASVTYDIVSSTLSDYIGPKLSGQVPLVFGELYGVIPWHRYNDDRFRDGFHHQGILHVR